MQLVAVFDVGVRGKVLQDPSDKISKGVEVVGGGKVASLGGLWPRGGEKRDGGGWVGPHEKGDLVLKLIFERFKQP
jgi:hypothetical protein